METAAVAIPVQQRWRGRPVMTERAESVGLRAQMIHAQQLVADELMASCDGPPFRMHIWWEVSPTQDGPSFEWNPQVGVPDNAVRLICRGEVE